MMDDRDRIKEAPPLEDRGLPEGQLVTAKDGTRYRVANVQRHQRTKTMKNLNTGEVFQQPRVVETHQLERDKPKVRGKAARRAEKKARRLARERLQRPDRTVIVDRPVGDAVVSTYEGENRG